MKIGASIAFVVLWALVTWPGLSAGSASDSTELLARAGLANELLYSDLRNFVCYERIDRFRGPLGKTGGRRIDTVTSKVSFENGTEHYSDIYQDATWRPRMSSLSGAWSEGEFGTLLLQTQALLRSHAALFSEEVELNGASTMLYRLEVSEPDSPWDLVVDWSHYRIPFRTDVWVSRSSGQILKIERTSTSIPLAAGISELRWSVSLEKVDLNGRNWLLPKSGEYAVSYGESHRREWNVLSFSGYQRYGSEITLSFDHQ